MSLAPPGWRFEMTFCIPRKALSRRTMLRGFAGAAAVGIALPRLGAMLNGNGDAYAAGDPLSPRFGVWFWGNGSIPEVWVPGSTGVGESWALSPQLEVYAPVRENLTVITGHDVKVGGSAHKEGPAGALSGRPQNGQGNYAGPTIDHMIADLIGGDSPFKALHVGVSRATANAAGQAINYASSSGENTPVMPEYDARALFDRLFAHEVNSPTEGPNHRAFIRGHVLDAVREDIHSLNRRLGAEDARRLEQHLEGINELQLRIQAAEDGGVEACSQESLNPADFPEVVQDLEGSAGEAQNLAMAQLVTYALSCDLTKVFLFQHGRPAAHYDMSNIGINVDVHDNLSHQEGGLQPILQTAMQYWHNQGRVLMEMLQNTPDGDGNLLENSLVYATSDVSFGRTHSVQDYPILLFGRARGAIKGNQHVRRPGANVSEVLLTLLNLYGANLTEFGGGGGHVTSGISEILV